MTDTTTNSPPLYTRYPTELPKTLPKTFPIGEHNALPLVDTSELEAHLKVLGAFDKLREHVEAQPGLAGSHKDGAWALFLARAVYRFERWTEGVVVSLGAHSEAMCPPIDVAMVSLMCKVL